MAYQVSINNVETITLLLETGSVTEINSPFLCWLDKNLMFFFMTKTH